MLHFFFSDLMKYLINSSKKIFYIKRQMSSFKLRLWPDYMFVNKVVPSGQTKEKLIITMLTPFTNAKRINLCRSTNDTIKILIERLKIKLNESCDKKKLKSKIISIKSNEIVVPNNSKCGEIFDQSNSHITLEVDDSVFKVVFNLPIINDIKLNTFTYKGLMLYPFALENAYNVSFMDSKFTWFKIDSKNQVEVGNESFYIPTEDDIDCHLKLVISPCNEGGQFGPVAEVLSSKVQKNNVDIYPYENRLKTKPNNRYVLNLLQIILVIIVI